MERLTKVYGDTTAVEELSVEIAPGRVTGFLGPNGAGKSTTMRLILGLDHPTAGRALIDGQPYAQLHRPLQVVGALLEADAFHPGRSARNHLLAMARSNGLPTGRIDEVLAQVGLSKVADRRAGSFSLGMRQRLGIAGALLGDPSVLLFDEPVNGLDPDGVRWVRTLMRSLAAEGRTIFVSSHLMSEMQLTADHLIVIARGRLLAEAPTQDLLDASSRSGVTVRSTDVTGIDALAATLAAQGAVAARVAADRLRVVGAPLELVGDLAHEVGLDHLHELSYSSSSLEDAFMELTGDSLEYRGMVEPSPEADSGDLR